MLAIISKLRLVSNTSYALITHPQLSSSTTKEQFSINQTMFLPSQEFLENGPSHMRMCFSNSIIPPELICKIMPYMITYAKEVVQNCRSDTFHYESPNNFRLFTLVLDVNIQKLYHECGDGDNDGNSDDDNEEKDDDEDNDDDDDSDNDNEIITKMVPASKTAIESLKKVWLEGICLMEFDDGTEATSMPCEHVYHQECLVQWLKTSHTCPLCRYPIPT